MVIVAMNVVFFQNCGDEGSGFQDTLYDGSGYAKGDCLSETVDCGPSSDYLQITADMGDNAIIKTSSMLASGRCNQGNFPSYEIQWQILDGNGTVRKSGTNSTACKIGKYQFTVSVSGLSNNVNYTFKVTMIGVDDQGLTYENFANNGSAQLDFSLQ